MITETLVRGRREGEEEGVIMEAERERDFVIAAVGNKGSGIQAKELLLY